MLTTTSSNMRRYDEAERNVGIAAYVSPDAPGFAAVSKARYSDFLVREVDGDGNVARLTSLENNLKDALEDADGKDGEDQAQHYHGVADGQNGTHERIHDEA